MKSPKRPGQLHAEISGFPAGTIGMVEQVGIEPYPYKFFPKDHRNPHFYIIVPFGYFTCEGHGVSKDTLTLDGQQNEAQSSVTTLFDSNVDKFARRMPELAPA